MKKWCLSLGIVVLVHGAWASERVGIPFPAFLDRGDSLMPFGLTELGLESMRYQQVYSSEPLAAVNPTGVWILEISFIDHVASNWRAELPLFQINLSTTSRGPEDLSSVFAENVGMDDTVVFGPAGHEFVPSSSDPFGTRLPLNQPYFFDPSRGNLLLDIRNYMPERESGYPELNDLWPAHLTQDLVNDQVARVYAPDVNATMGTVDSVGFLTLFVVQVPEPSTWALGGVAVIVAAGVALRKRLRKGAE